MVQAIINLTEEENTYLNIFKAQRNIRSKNDAIKALIKERLEQDREDLEFAKRSEELLEHHLNKKDRKTMSRDDFLDELKTW